MIKQHPITAILTYVLLITCMLVMFAGVINGFSNTHLALDKLFISIFIVLFVAIVKSFLCTLLLFAFYYFEIKHKYILVALCMFVLMLPVTFYTATNFNLYLNASWFDKNLLLITILIASTNLLILIKQAFYTLDNDLIKVSILDGTQVQHFFMDVYLPIMKLNLFILVLTQFIYGYAKF